MGFGKAWGIRKVVDGRSEHPLYKHWRNMMSSAFKNNALVCVRWHDFWAFALDLQSNYDKPYKFFVRWDASKEWRMGNVRFTNSTSERAFGRTTTKKIDVGGVTMSTKQITELMRKEGVQLEQAAFQRRANAKSDIIAPNAKKAHFYRDEWRSLKEISTLLGIDYCALKYHNKYCDLDEAIRKTASNLHRRKEYTYKGATYNQTELANVLAKENPELKPGGIRNRLKKGASIEDCLKGYRQA